MHLSFLDFLIDPETGERFSIEIDEKLEDFIIYGKLKSSKNEYPIIRGIPRFVSFNSYAKSFGFQWKKWSKVQFESYNKGKSMEGHTLKMFEKITGIKGDLKNKTILDIGCGAGRFIEIILMKGGKAIGVDISEAVESAYKNFKFNEKVLIIQADALNLPLVPRSVDGAFSIGVFHHLPDPERAFLEMVKCVKPGGWVAVSVYRKYGYYDSPRVNLWRKFFNFLKPIFGFKPALIYSYIAGYILYYFTFIPILGHLIRLFFPIVRLSDVKWRVLDTFDSITPVYQHTYEPYEVFRWFKKAGLIEIEPTEWGGASFRGKLP